MLVPQALAYAQLAGLPPIHGLYASTLPLLAYAALGSARTLAVGPAALDALLVGAALLPLSGVARPGAAALLAALTGAILLAARLVGAGALATLLTEPVIAGFTTAAALKVGATQLGPLLGLESTGAWWWPDATTAAVGLLGLAWLVGLRRHAPRLPGALLWLIVAGAGAYALPGRVDTVGAVPSGLPTLALPALEPALALHLTPYALALALVASTEALSIGGHYASQRGERVDPARELLGLGAANLGAALVGGYNVGAGFSRTAVLVDAGGRSRLALVATAAGVVATLLGLTSLVAFLPRAALAAVVVAALPSFVRLDVARSLWRSDRAAALVLALTAAATIGLGVVPGLALGVIADRIHAGLRR